MALLAICLCNTSMSVFSLSIVFDAQVAQALLVNKVLRVCQEILDILGRKDYLEIQEGLDQEVTLLQKHLLLISYYIILMLLLTCLTLHVPLVRSTWATWH